jgi:membrane-bound ClpP family serine protease
MDYLVWALILLAVGLLFLVLEFFVPSSGLLGVLCGLSIVGAIVLGFMAGPLPGSAILLAVLVIVPVLIIVGVQWWPETPIGKLILIPRPASSEEVLPPNLVSSHRDELVGKRGIARSLMLPGGVVEIDRQSFDAVSTGLTIEPGQPIVVVAVDTHRLIVRADNSIVAAELSDVQPANPLDAQIPDPFAEG